MIVEHSTFNPEALRTGGGGRGSWGSIITTAKESREKINCAIFSGLESRTIWIDHLRVIDRLDASSLFDRKKGKGNGRRNRSKPKVVHLFRNAGRGTKVGEKRMCFWEKEEFG